MLKEVWFLDKMDFYKILCPRKYGDHLKTHPLDTYRKMDFLFLQEDNAREIFLVDQGKVKIGYYDEAGNEYVKAILGRGEIFGEMAFLGENRHRDFAEVIEDNTQICKMTVEKARDLARDYVPFGLELNKRIGQRIRKLERRIEILLFKDAKLRLLEFLHDLAEDAGRPKDEGVIIDHSLTQTDIASLIGTSRKTVSLLLNELEDEGQIQFSRRQIFIPNLSALASV